MSIAGELEKLSSLRERGELSDEEFQQAKALLLSGESAEPAPASVPDVSEKGNKERRTQFLVALLSTVAALLSGASAALDPSLFKIGMVIFWMGLSITWWVTYSKAKTG